ncbi:hypothetical protein M405DRAFT_824783 [Rhizopogon salebrosus TDB-379]|nr:hypothetical protein M405DRAFT_824783 [Rhizopogon salebrosus TDB-379]
MSDSRVGSPATVVLRAPLGNSSLSAIRQFFPSVTFTFRRRSPRGDENLQEAEAFLQVTEKQLDAIYKASQQVNETFAEEISQIEDELNDIQSTLKTAKKARGGRSTLKQTIKRLGDDAATQDILEAARNLSEKAEHTSERVSMRVTLQTVPSSEYSEVPDDELTAQTRVCGIGFSFDGTPTADDAKKIQGIVHLVDPYFDYDDREELQSVRVVRSRKSDLSTYSFHYWGQDAYKTGESRPLSDDTSSQLSSSQSRSSTGMQLGAHAAFHHCHFHLLSMQSSDNSKISDATSNLGVSSVGRGHADTSPLPSACPSCCGSQSAEAMQTTGISPEDITVEDIQSATEQRSPVASSSQTQNTNPAVTAQSPSETDPGEGGDQQASPLKAGTSHSLTVSGAATVFSPTMNFNSTGCIGATNIYRGGQAPGNCPPKTTAQSQVLERSGFKSMQFNGNSVSYNATFSDESHNSAGAYNEEVGTPAS